MVSPACVELCNVYQQISVIKPSNVVIPEKLTVPQLVKRFSAHLRIDQCCGNATTDDSSIVTAAMSPTATHALHHSLWTSCRAANQPASLTSHMSRQQRRTPINYATHSDLPKQDITLRDFTLVKAIMNIIVSCDFMLFSLEDRYTNV